MANVKLVCDASYEEGLKLTGYAGGLYVSEEHETTIAYTYNGGVGELENIQEGELLAILSGLRELSTRVTASKLNVGDIEIYTDSKSSVLTLMNNKPDEINDPRTNFLFKQIKKLCTKNNWNPKVSHVSSHVDLQNANGIERLNSIADEQANEARKEIKKHILSPQIDDTSTSILLPSSINGSVEKNAFSDIAHALANQNKTIRLYIDGPIKKHPFLLTLKNNHPDFLRDKVTLFSPPKNDPSIGLNSLLYRHHNIVRGITPSEDNPETKKRAFLSAAILHGDLSFKPNSKTKLPILSSKFYDLLNPLPLDKSLTPDSIQGWASHFCDYTNTPRFEGLKAVYEDLSLSIKNTLPHRSYQSTPNLENSTDSPHEAHLRKTIRIIIEKYGKELEPKQLSNKIVDAVIENGAPKDPLFKEGLKRFVFISPKSNIDVFINRIIKQAEKLTPRKKERENIESNNFSPFQKNNFKP